MRERKREKSLLIRPVGWTVGRFNDRDESEWLWLFPSIWRLIRFEPYRTGDRTTNWNRKCWTIVSRDSRCGVVANCNGWIVTSTMSEYMLNNSDQNGKTKKEKIILFRGEQRVYGYAACRMRHAYEHNFYWHFFPLFLLKSEPVWFRHDEMSDRQSTDGLSQLNWSSLLSHYLKRIKTLNDRRNRQKTQLNRPMWSYWGIIRAINFRLLMSDKYPCEHKHKSQIHKYVMRRGCA